MLLCGWGLLVRPGPERSNPQLQSQTAPVGTLPPQRQSTAAYRSTRRLHTAGHSAPPLRAASPVPTHIRIITPTSTPPHRHISKSCTTALGKRNRWDVAETDRYSQRHPQQRGAAQEQGSPPPFSSTRLYNAATTRRRTAAADSCTQPLGRMSNTHPAAAGLDCPSNDTEVSHMRQPSKQPSAALSPVTHRCPK